MQAKTPPLARGWPDGQLSLPLFFSDKATVIPFPQMRNDAQANTYEWTAQEISQIREMLLMDSLRNLTDGRATLVKTEVMDWMMSDELEPFSFRTCASDMGFDYIEIRVRVLRMIHLIEKKMKADAALFSNNKTEGLSQ